MAEGGEKGQIHRGLQGVHFDRSRVCHMRAVFAVGRVPGWTVQVMEQLENNILNWPLTLYDGPARRDYVAIDAR